MAVDIQFIIDGQDRGQPLNAKDFGVSITEVVEINARIVSFDNDLIFGNDMYSYLFEKLADTGFCNLVEVVVNYECSDDWVRLTNGYIVVSECSFDLDKCQVTTKVYDDTFSTKINNNKSIPFSLALTTSKNNVAIAPPTVFFGNFFNPADGVYDYEYVGVVSVYEAFRHLINCMSDGLVDFESSLFFWEATEDHLNTLIITNGTALRNRDSSETVVSFEQLYIALKKKLNLGMGFERQSNGRPLLRIELESYFYQSGVNVNLYDQPSINLIFDKERLFQAVNFGADPFLEKQECDSGSTPCTFLQTPFRGFRDETFGFTGECNTSAILDLRTNDVIFDTNVIEDIFRFNVDTYATNPIIVDADYFFTFPLFEMNKFDPYSIGQGVYNGSLTNNNVSASWLGGFPNSLFSFFEPFDPSLTSFSATTNYTAPLPNWGIVFPGLTSYAAFNGSFIPFGVETDPNNLWDGQTYTVPFTGIYTFDLQLIITNIGVVGATAAKPALKHYTPDDVIIETFYGTEELLSTNRVLTLTQSIVCNAGDLIRSDVEGRFTGAGPAGILELTNTYFSNDAFILGSGVPLNPLELEAVNIDDVRAYLYNFERPLTMGEIQAVLDNTSKPIAFGRHDDPLRVIEGFIKKVNIASIIRQKAAIELKSNRLLR
jgi:hypothetical protein